MSFDCIPFTVKKHIDITAIWSIHYFEFDDGFQDELEAHEPWELVYIDRGCCRIVAEDRTFMLNQGELYFHKPYERHMLETVKGVAPNIFIITFSSSSPAMRFFEDRKLTASVTAKQHIAAIIHEASATFDLPFNDPKMQRLVRRENPLLGGDQSLLLRLELMLIEMVRAGAPYLPEPKMYYPKEIVRDEFALRVISFMEERLYSRFTMEELAQAFSFSKSYISRYFLRVCGHSVIDYFNRMKVTEAKRLIRETDDNFCEISERLMIANSHYFSTLFKKHTGMTPSQYKRSCKS